MTTLAQFIAKAQCHLFGHRRGRRVSTEREGDKVFAKYECPRCAGTWFRKIPSTKGTK